VSRRLSGLNAWLAQRMSAVYLGLFVLIAGGFLLVAGPPASHAQWQALLARPGVNLAAILFFVALITHGWVGIRDVIVDYVKPTGVRFAVLAFFAVGLLACGLWALRILFRVA
jgi:succinate dehydrogenase / fumarate reductase membrane anchor subunit